MAILEGRDMVGLRERNVWTCVGGLWMYPLFV